MPLNIDWQQILLHLLNFVLLFGILYFLLYAPVKRFMDERTAHYKEMDEAARKNLEAAEEAKKSYMEKLQKAEDEIEAKKAAAISQAQEICEAKKRSAQEESENIIASAREKAEKEYEKILEKAQPEISAMVMDAAEKLMLHADTGKTYETFLDAAERGGSDANE